ncbi:MAG: DNRLRE domain-containing protein [bacterium]
MVNNPSTGYRHIVSRSIFFCLMVSACVTAVSAQVQVHIHPSKDNTLYEDDAGSLSNGKGTGLFVGRVSTGGGEKIRRGLLAFDIAANIPASATIQSVTLTLNMSRTSAADQGIELLRVQADWGEGTSTAAGQGGGGAAATTGDATWLHTFFDTDLWTTAGGDFSNTVSASQTVGGIASYTWGSTAEMVADVQDWLVSPSGNFGWVLIGNESTGGTTKRFDSRESSNPPVLTVEYILSGDNNPPNIFFIADQTMDEGATLIVGLSATDIDGDPVTLGSPNLPPFGILRDHGNGTGVITFSPKFADAGEYLNIAVTATDDGGLSDTSMVNLTVNDVPIANDPPDLDPIADQTMDEGDALFVDLSGSDPDGDAITLSSPNLPLFGTLTDNGDGSGVIIFIPGFTDAGEYLNIEVVATDVFGFRDSEFFTLTVNNDLGRERYETLCQRCHGDPWAGPSVDPTLVAGRRVTGARVCSIKRAAFGVPGDPVFPNGVPLMKHLTGEITDADIPEISAFLNSRPVSGKRRFITTCSACHGKDAKGGPVDEDVRGHEGDKIRDAIEDERPMRFLSCLTWADTQEIGNYLEKLKDDDDDGNDNDDDDGRLLTAIENKTMNEGETLESTVVATGPNGYKIRLGVINLPSFGSFVDEGNGVGTLTLAPTFEDAGVFSNIKVIASAQGSPPLSDKETFTLTVNDVSPPTSVEGKGGLVDEYALEQNYPNPFNPVTEIRFQIPEASQVVLRIFNILGKEVRTLIHTQYVPGLHRIIWDGKDNQGKAVPSGVYFYQLQAGSFSQVKKMGLIR